PGGVTEVGDNADCAADGAAAQVCSNVNDDINAFGGLGDDTITFVGVVAPLAAFGHGQAGVDTLTGGDGVDDLDGGPDNDTLVGGAGNDNLNGGPGSDTFDAGLGNDLVDGGP